MQFHEIFREVDILNRLRLSGVSRSWKDVMSSPALEKAMFFDLSDLGDVDFVDKYGLDEHPLSCQAWTFYLDQPNGKRHFYPGLTFYNFLCAFLYYRKGSAANTGIARYITPRTKVLRVSCSREQAESMAPDWSDKWSVPGGRTVIARFLQVIQWILHDNRSITHVLLENFWLEGRLDLWTRFKWTPNYRACRLDRDEKFVSNVSQVALKSCYFYLEARFWPNGIIWPPGEPLPICVPEMGCLYQPLPAAYSQFAHSAPTVVFLNVQKPQQSEADITDYLEEYSAPVPEELCVRIRTKISLLTAEGKRIWKSQLQRMESEVYANAGDICLDTVDWTSLKKTTLHFFLSFKDVCDLPLSENYKLVCPYGSLH